MRVNACAVAILRYIIHEKARLEPWHQAISVGACIGHSLDIQIHDLMFEPTCVNVFWHFSMQFWVNGSKVDFSTNKGRHDFYKLKFEILLTQKNPIMMELAVVSIFYVSHEVGNFVEISLFYQGHQGGRRIPIRESKACTTYCTKQVEIA